METVAEDNCTQRLRIVCDTQNEVVDSCSSTMDLSDNVKIPQISQSWRSHSCSKLSSCLQNKTLFAQKIRKRRKPVMMKFRSPKSNTYDHHAPFNTHKSSTQVSREEHKPYSSTKFQQREITTIHEEVFHRSRSFSDRELRMHHTCRKRYTKKKEHNEKVASLKVIVARLTKMCVEKPEMLQDTLPDETIKLFKSIHI